MVKEKWSSPNSCFCTYESRKCRRCSGKHAKDDPHCNNSKCHLGMATSLAHKAIIERNPEDLQSYMLDGDLQSLLTLACYVGAPECARVLLKNGADSNLCGPEETVFDSPLRIAACLNGNNIELLDLLLTHGANLELDKSILSYPCLNGYLKTVEYLISKGINVNPRDNEWTPLHHAASKSSAIVQVLLDHSADPLICAGKGYSHTTPYSLGDRVTKGLIKAWASERGIKQATPGEYCPDYPDKPLFFEHPNFM